MRSSTPTSEAVESTPSRGQIRANDAHAVPVIRIGAGTESLVAHFKESWRHRELMYFLVWRDLKVRYRQTALGVAWAVLQPLLTMLLLTVFFGRVPGLSPAGVPYALFALTGLVPWMFFANAVNDSSNSVIVNPELITKVYVPRMLVPAASVTAHLVDFAIAFSMLAILLFVYRAPVTTGIVLLPFCVLLVAALALAVGTLMAALNVRYRDIRYALPFMVQLWLFASPVIYSPALVPERWRWVLTLNPLTGILQGFRTALLGTPLDGVSLGVAAALTLAALFWSARYFRRVATSFADVI